MSDHDSPPQDPETDLSRLPDVHVFIGTKAQYIKTAPLMRLLQERGIPYQLIDTGQHAAFSPALRRELGVKDPNVVLRDTGNVKTVTEAAKWMAQMLATIALRPGYLRREVFAGRQGICIVHGDTPSTLLAALAAKRAGLQVALIEAGLRSHNLLRPFPEEFVRIVCMRIGDYLFAPSDWAHENMVKMRLAGRLYNIEQNTNVEAAYYSLEQTAGETLPPRPYCLMTIHRVETILSRARVEHVVSLAEYIAERMTLQFVMHDPTRKKLQDFGMLERITQNPKILTSNLVPHAKFLALMASAEFVVTDGGSIQEESHYLDVPALVMRSETERQEGIGGNVRLSGFDDAKARDFVENYEDYTRGQRVANQHPSRTILKLLAEDNAPRVATLGRIARAWIFGSESDRASNGAASS